MTCFLGEFECRLDTKSRIVLPAAFKKQLPPEAEGRFVMNRGFEKHLVLYPRHEWEVISAEVNRLNLYVKKNRAFVRYFFRGATEIALDGAGRLLLPKRLLAYSEVNNEVVLFGYNNRIEVWARELYYNLMDDEPEDFADLAEELMGSVSSSAGGGSDPPGVAEVEIGDTHPYGRH